MLFEPGQGPGYEPPSKKSREGPGPESRSPDPGVGFAFFNKGEFGEFTEG